MGRSASSATPTASGGPDTTTAPGGANRQASRVNPSHGSAVATAISYGPDSNASAVARP